MISQSSSAIFDFNQFYFNDGNEDLSVNNNPLSFVRTQHDDPSFDHLRTPRSLPSDDFVKTMRAKVYINKSQLEHLDQTKIEVKCSENQCCANEPSEKTYLGGTEVALLLGLLAVGIGLQAFLAPETIPIVLMLV